MQGIYTYIPETNYVPREYSIAVILWLLFMVLISLVSVLNLLYFYISIFRSMCAVPMISGNLNFLEPSGPLQACNGTAFTCMTNQQMHIYKYIQSHTIIINQTVSITPVTIIRVSYNMNAIISRIQKSLQRSTMIPSARWE